MNLHQLISYIPFKSIVFVFILWANSSFAPKIKNVGFYCDDESIKKPFHGDSIHLGFLFTVLLGLFPIIVYSDTFKRWPGEKLSLSFLFHGTLKHTLTLNFSYVLLSVHYKLADFVSLVTIYKIYLTEVLCRKSKSEEASSQNSFCLLLRNYYSGFLLMLGLTEVLKLLFCELRPHFFSTCLPDMNNIRCSDGYITQFNCTGKGRAHLLGRDIYKSFPSGHASLSSFSFVFLNVYLSARMKSVQSISPWWCRSISVITFLWTAVCCLSRILDNRHYWWDVLVGIGIGIFGGFIAVNKALKTISKKKSTLEAKCGVT